MKVFLFLLVIFANQMSAQWDRPQQTPDEYLVITPNHFVTYLQPLIKWRQREGLEVSVKTIEEIKEAFNLKNLSADKLQEFLTSYFEIRPNLVYVLLVGDIEFIPVKYKNGDATDLYYSLLDDEDYLPDVYLGRLPVNNSLELTNVIEKIISYETTSSSKKVLLAAYFQDLGLDGISDKNYIYLSEKYRSFLVKQKYICHRAYTKTPGSTPKKYQNLTPVPKDISFNTTTTDIIHFINADVDLINHRGHGKHSGWKQPSFSTKDLYKLWNRRYPIFFSISCATGKFDCETAENQINSKEKESFAEKILTMKYGAVAVIAPSRETNNSLSDIFNKGLMGAIWPKMFNLSSSPATRLGQVLLRGRIQVVREVSGGNWFDERIKGNLRKYHLLGDPALKIFPSLFWKNSIRRQ